MVRTVSESRKMMVPLCLGANHTWDRKGTKNCVGTRNSNSITWGKAGGTGNVQPEGRKLRGLNVIRIAMRKKESTGL